ncbi:MAG: DUF2207 domain-containing protein [Clostridia bacterium]|nr:DUF2207 domain-containing protein [Clostridia bacterium]
MSNKISNFFGLIFMSIIAGIIIFAIIFSYVFPTAPVPIEDNSAEYNIGEYTTSITVNQNNTLSVNETIKVNFLVASHGIFRALPTINEVKNVDGEGNVISSKKFRVNYTNITVDKTFDTYTENDFLFIQIGSQYSYAQAEETYVLSYIVELDSRYADYNQFYYNILGNLWDTTISDFTAIITFPTPVDASAPLTEIYVGEYGSTTQIDGDWTENNTVLTITHSILAVGEGITVLVNLQEGFFTAPYPHLLDIFMLVLIVIFAIIAIVLYKKTSNKKMLVPVVQFSVNKKFTSADVGYIIDKTVDNKDIASLIILWAQKGYLEIIEEKKKTFLRKLKNADNDMKQYEKTLFEAIFGNQDKKIDISKIGEKILSTIQTTKTSIKIENEKAFSTKAELARSAIIIIMGILFGVVLFAINYQNVNTFFTYLSVFVAIAIVVSLFVWSKKQDMKDIINAKNKFYSKVSTLILLAGIFVFVFFSYDKICDIFFTSFIVFAELIFTIYLLSKFNIRTNDGIADMGDIVGLKNFIEVTEKDRLELLAKENPTMFFDIMPYAYVLGVYEEWCKKFENIVIETPTWYVGNNLTFNYLLMLNIMHSTTNSFLQAVNTAQFAKMASTVTSNKTFGGSGGGFSGGGFGGGGGGRW